MRITNSMMSSGFLADANRGLSKVLKYQSQVESTKRISRLSDDPIATINALRARNRLSALDMYRGNISTAKRNIELSEAAVDKANEALKRAYELLIDARTNVKTDEERAIIAEEVKNLRDELVSIGNTTMETAYLFGAHNATGSQSALSMKEPPFTVDEATGCLLYNRVCMYADEVISDYEGVFSGLEAAIAAYEGSAGGFAEEGALERSVSALGGLAAGAGELTERAASLAALLGADSTMFDTARGLAADLEAAGETALQAAKAEPFDETAAKAAAEAVKTAFAGLKTELETADKLSALQSGAADAKAALALDGAKSVKLKLGGDQEIESNITGLQLFGEGDKNFYYVLDRLYKGLSQGASMEELAPQITTLQKQQSRLLSVQTDLGGKLSRLEMLDDRYVTTRLSFEEMKSEYEDVDLAEAIMNLNSAQNVYKAALAAGSNIIQVSLLDFLR